MHDVYVDEIDKQLEIATQYGRFTEPNLQVSVFENATSVCEMTEDEFRIFRKYCELQFGTYQSILDKIDAQLNNLYLSQNV